MTYSKIIALLFLYVLSECAVRTYLQVFNKIILPSDVLHFFMANFIVR